MNAVKRTGWALLVTALTISSGAVMAAGAAELYGKPLRGLSPVPLAAVVASPDKYAGKPIRVEGMNRGEEGRVVLKDGEASLAIDPIGFEFPPKTGEVAIAAEGKVVRGEKGAVSLRATGAEIRR